MRAKKRLGQNFLKNKRILEEIIRVGEVSKKDVILEAGPGHGECRGKRSGFNSASSRKIFEK